MSIADLRGKLAAIPGYAELFERAFPGEPISDAAIARALAAFERTLVSGPAPFDRWIGGEQRAISDRAQQGFALFNGRARCSACHAGWNFTDGSFHDIGVADADLGRGKLLPKLTSQQHAFKTPTLRDIARRAPYLHNGSEKDLAAVIDFYDRGGRARRPSLAEEIRPLNLTSEEKASLVEFLRTLTSDAEPITVPELPN